jgi:hypothetical protein
MAVAPLARHIGIVAVSAEGAALCYRTICTEGAAILGPHSHPQVSMPALDSTRILARAALREATLGAGP